MDWTQCSAVDRSAGKLGGAWCFRGTRVPVATLFEHLDRGSTVDEFLEWFPSVSRELVHEVLAFTSIVPPSSSGGAGGALARPMPNQKIDWSDSWSDEDLKEFRAASLKRLEAEESEGQS